MAKRPAYAKHEPRLQNVEQRLEELECRFANMSFDVTTMYLTAMKPKPAPWWKRFLGIDQ